MMYSVETCPTIARLREARPALVCSPSPAYNELISPQNSQSHVQVESQINRVESSNYAPESEQICQIITECISSFGVYSSLPHQITL